MLPMDKLIYCVHCKRKITCFPIPDLASDFESTDYLHMGCMKGHQDEKTKQSSPACRLPPKSGEKG